MSKTKELNVALMGMENELLRRSLERSRGETEHAYEFINKLADDDIIELECKQCDDEVDPEIDDIKA